MSEMGFDSRKSSQNSFLGTRAGVMFHQSLDFVLCADRGGARLDGFSGSTLIK